MGRAAPAGRGAHRKLRIAGGHVPGAEAVAALCGLKPASPVVLYFGRAAVPVLPFTRLRCRSTVEMCSQALQPWVGLIGGLVVSR